MFVLPTTFMFLWICSYATVCFDYNKESGMHVLTCDLCYIKVPFKCFYLFNYSQMALSCLQLLLTCISLLGLIKMSDFRANASLCPPQLEQLQCELTRVLRERDAYKARYEKLLGTNHSIAGGEAPATHTSNPPSPPPDYFLWSESK